MSKHLDFFTQCIEPLKSQYAKFRYNKGERVVPPIKDYQPIFNEIAAKHSVVILEMHSSPFGFTFICEGRKYKAEIDLSTCKYVTL